LESIAEAAASEVLCGTYHTQHLLVLAAILQHEFICG